MLKVEKGFLGGECYIVCRVDEIDKELIYRFIDNNNGEEEYYCDNGVCLQLNEILEGVSRPIDEDKVYLVEEAVEKLNQSILPEEKVYTLKITQTQLNTLKTIYGDLLDVTECLDCEKM